MRAHAPLEAHNARIGTSVLFEEKILCRATLKVTRNVKKAAQQHPHPTAVRRVCPLEWAFICTKFVLGGLGSGSWRNSHFIEIDEMRFGDDCGKWL